MVDGTPMRVGDQVIFHTPDNGLTAFGVDARSALWQAGGVPPILRWSASSGALGLMTSDNAMLTFSLGGQLLDQARLREPGSRSAGAICWLTLVAGCGE